MTFITPQLKSMPILTVIKTTVCFGVQYSAISFFLLLLKKGCMLTVKHYFSLKEIPILPGDEHTKGDAPNPIHSEDHNNAGTNVTDDGFGAFRSSTSFNDLATLLPPDGTSKGAPGQPDAHPGAPHAQAPDSSIVVSDAPVNATLKEDSTHPVPVAPTPAVSALLSQPTASAPKRKASTTLAPKNVKKQAAGVVTAAPLAKSGIQVPGTFVAAMEAKLVAQKPAAGTTPRANPAPAAGKTNATDKKILSSVAPDNASSTPSKSVTEADFKGVAQAAVSSLILSTKNGELPPGDGSGDGEKVDTSTAHIKALTGTNWVTACSGVGAAAVAINSGDPKSNNNRSKRQNLTADERARQNRDRNREHARNTRLRKKAYVEELKRTLTELVAQRDKADLEKRQVAQREVEQREVRFRVIEEYLKLRSRNESNYASWAAILDANFKLTLPATEFLEDGESAGVPDPTAGVKLEKTFTGVPAVMAESNKFASFLQTLGSASKISECNSVGFVYTGDRSDFFMDDNQAVLEWTANTVGLTMRVSACSPWKSCLVIVFQKKSNIASCPLSLRPGCNG